MDGPEQLTTLDGAFADLPLSVVMQIDKLADSFETAWRRGDAPGCNEFVEQLSGASEVAKATFNSHLRHLQAELELAGRNGTEPSPAETPASHSLEVASPHPSSIEQAGFQLPRAVSSVDQPVTVGEYRLLEQLGSGGMGVVYKAIHRRLDRFVAIKFPRFAGVLDRRSAARFLREAMLIGRLAHPHIVRALDAGESLYGPYLVTEFIDGETIDVLVRRAGPLPFAQAVKLVEQAARGLAYAHSQDIVHRDIKPSNMLLDEAGVLRIVDFGLAKLLADDGRKVETSQNSDGTEFGTFLGTVGYAAPEQLRPDGAVDHRADIYALGCVLYFMLTGEAPHKGTIADRLLTHRRSRASTLRFGRNDLPSGFEKTWQGMVADSPRSRFSSMLEVEQAMQSALVDRPRHRHQGGRAYKVLFSILASVALCVLLAWIGFRGGLSWQHPTPTGSPPALAVSPFSAKQAARHQLQWAQYLRQPVRVVNEIGMPLVLIPAGEYVMGTSRSSLLEPAPTADDWRFREPAAVLREQRPHRVVLTKPFYLGETEVTYGQFRQFVDATGYVTDAERTRGWGKEDKGWLKRAGYSWKNTGQRVSDDRHPVINVTWNDAAALCTWLTSHDRRGEYRMPTEAEWEYACRAGSTTDYSFGNAAGELVDHAWFAGNSEGRFQPVGLKSANPFGLHDMYGNRQEWCQDNYAADFYELSPVRDPVCENGSGDRVMRGGAHTDLASFCISTRRWNQDASNPGAAGIRVVLEVQALPKAVAD